MTPKSPQDFAEAIRRKYPTGVASDGRAYSQINDIELSRKWVQANPEYKDAVEFPKIDMAAAMAAGGSTRIQAEDDVPMGANVDVQRVNGQLMSTPRAPQSMMSEQAEKQKSFMGIDRDISMTGLKERFGDVKETGQAVYGQMRDAGQDIVDTATRNDRNILEKATMIGGRGFQGVAGVLGETLIGAGKIALTQEAEDKVANIAQKVGQGVADTEIAQDLAGWYNELDPRTRDQVDAAGGFMSLLGELVGVKGSSVVGKGAREGIDTAIDVVQPVVQNIPENVANLNRQATESLTNAGRTIDNVFTATDAKLQSRIQDAYQKGVKPTIQGKQTIGQVDKYKNNVQTAISTIADRKDTLKYTDNLGEVATGRTPETLNEFAQAVQQSKNKIYGEYNTIATQAGEGGLKLNTASMADELDELINSQSLQLTSPEAVAYAKTVQERYRGIGQIDAQTAQDVIKQYNNSLQAFYKNPTPEGATRNAVDALMVNKLRQQLDEGIMELTGEQYQTLKNQYASLKTIEKDVLNATLRDARRNQSGLIDYTDIFTGGQAVAAIASMNPAAIAGAATQRGIKSYMKYINDPNTQVRRMFEANDKIKSGQEIEPGFFERTLPNVGAGLSIRSTVKPPDVIAENLSLANYRTIKEYLLNPADGKFFGKAQNLMEEIGIENATDVDQMRYLKEVADEYDRVK